MNLHSLRKEDEEQFIELKEKEFGSRFSEYVFSAFYHDLVTELFNKETKDTCGLFRWVFSTNIDSVNTWVNTIHIYPWSCLKTAIACQNLFKAQRVHKNSSRTPFVIYKIFKEINIRIWNRSIYIRLSD